MTDIITAEVLVIFSTNWRISVLLKLKFSYRSDFAEFDNWAKVLDGNDHFDGSDK